MYFNFIYSNEAHAEETCEKCLSEALKYSPVSFDANIQISNLRILRRRDDEALGYMEKIYQHIINCINQNDDSSLPNVDILLNLAKNYSELTQYVKAIKILDTLIRLNDEDLECWYLLAFNHYSIQNYKHSYKCLKHFKTVSEKISFKSNEILDLEDAAKELAAVLEDLKKNSDDGELKNNNIEDAEDNDEEKMMNNSNTSDMNLD